MRFNIKCISIALNTKLTDVASSNRLLRALWASLRQEFGNLGWLYQPIKDGDSRRIYFGHASMITTSICIGVSYKERGIVDHILFEDIFIDKSDPIISRLKNCVRTAEIATESDFFMASEIITPSRYLFQDFNELNIFSLLTIDNRTSLNLRVSAFDQYDAQHNFNLSIRPIIDVLSAFSNLFFGIGKPNFSSTSYLDHIIQRPEYTLDADWIDGYPMIDGKIAMPEHCLKLIKDLSQNNINQQKQLILYACHHFHSARSLEQQAFEFSRTETLSEMAMVLYISCLEVLSSINAPSLETCRTCSQPQYRISARVEELVDRYLGANAADMVKNIYNDRSKYLHTGRLLSSRSYHHTSHGLIPQLDSSAKNGVRSPIMNALHPNIREFTSYCIRAVTYDLYNRQSSNESS